MDTKERHTTLENMEDKSAALRKIKNRNPALRNTKGDPLFSKRLKRGNFQLSGVMTSTIEDSGSHPAMQRQS